MTAMWYLTRVAKEPTGTKTIFVDLEVATDDEILGAIQENTKVCLSSVKSS
jgi:cystathionine gamma-lyase